MTCKEREEANDGPHHTARFLEQLSSIYCLSLKNQEMIGWTSFSVIATLGGLFVLEGGYAVEEIGIHVVNLLGAYDAAR